MKKNKSKGSQLSSLLSTVGITVSLVGLFIASKDLFELKEISISLFTGLSAGLVTAIIMYFAGNFYLRQSSLYKTVKLIEEYKNSINRKARSLINEQKALPTIFLSYSHEDKKYADKISRALLDTRLNLLILENTLNIGDNIIQKIEKSIEASDYFIFLISDNWLKSEFSQKELKLALEKNKRILPVVVGSIAIPSDLENIKYSKIDKNNPNESLEELLKALNIELERKTAANEG